MGSGTGESGAVPLALALLLLDGCTELKRMSLMTFKDRIVEVRGKHRKFVPGEVEN